MSWSRDSTRACRGRSRKQRAKSRPRGLRQAGITLIEITVVLVIIAVAASGVSLGFNAITRSALRSSCSKLIAATRFAYNQAVINGTTTRLSFSLPAEKFSIEEASGRIVLARVDDPRLEDEDQQRGAAGVDPWKAAEARVQDTYKPSLGASPFGPIGSANAMADGGPAKKSRYTDIPLGRGIRIVKLITPHDVDPVEEGDNGLYFFPGGQTEHAVIQLSDGGDKIYSIEIHPLTGKAKLHTEAYEPRNLLDNTDDDEDASEVDTP